MANALQTLSWLVGGAVVIGLGYFAYQKGLFDQAFDFVNSTIKGSGTSAKAEEEPAEAETPASSTKCKAGELEDSKGKCVKCATSLDSKDKCVKASAKQALSYLGGATSPYATHRFYAVVE